MSIKLYNVLILLFLIGCTQTERLIDRVPPVPPAIAPEPPVEAVTGSLWPQQGRALYPAEDRRARHVGDTLTVQLVERLQAEKSAGQQARQTSSRSLDLPDARPFSLVPEGLFAGASERSFAGSGAARQANRLSGEITVTVQQVLPNGALLVAGDRRIRLARGEEQVQLSGIVRPEDVGPDNRVLSTRVADARLRYTGTGEVAAQARQGWLARFFDRIVPF
jgi:flagellar L-ring protein precursor FlgH